MTFKRFLAAVLCVIAAFTLLASCDNRVTVNGDVPSLDTRVLEAFEKTDSAPYRMTVTNNVVFISGDGFLNEDSGVHTAVIYMDGKNFYAENDEDGVKTVAILVGETLYMNIGGAKSKYDVPLAQWELKYNELVGSLVPDEMSLLNFQDVTEVVNDDGSITATYKIPIPDAEFNMYDYSYTVSGVTASYKVDTDSVVYEFVIGADGRIKSTRSTMTMKVSVWSYDGSISSSATVSEDVYTVYDYEDVKEVTAPSDADEY